MAEKAVIELVADTSGLKPGFDALNALGLLSTEQQEAFAKANADYLALQQKVTSEVKKTTTAQTEAATVIQQTTKAVTDLKAAQDSLNKSKKVELEIGNSRTDSDIGTKAELKALNDKRIAIEAVTAAQKKQQLGEFQFTNAEATGNRYGLNAGQQVQSNIISAAAKKINEDLGKSMVQLGAETSNLTGKTVMLRTQIRLNEQAMAELQLQGKRNTKQYDELLVETGKLQRALVDSQTAVKNVGKDTKNIEGIIGIARGAAAAYNLAAASAQIFGDNNKDLQQTLIRTQTAMQLLLSVQELGNLVQQKSIAVQFIANGQRKLSIAITALETATESRFVVVQWLAIRAQLALNTAMEANPVMLLVGAFAALVALFVSYDEVVNGAAKAQIELNEAEQRGIELTKQRIEQGQKDLALIEARTAAVIKEYELENKGLEAIIEKQKDLYAKQRDQNQKDTDDAKRRALIALGLDKMKAASAMALSDLKDMLVKKEQDLQSDLNAKAVKDLDKVIYFMTGQVTLSDKIQGKNREAAKGQVDNLKSVIDMSQKALEQTAALGQKGIELDKQDQLQLLANLKARFETAALYELEANRKLSGARRRDERGALIEAEKLELQTTQHTVDEQNLIRAKYREQLRQLDAKYEIERLNDQRKAIDAELQLTIQGSQRQLALKLLELSTQEKAELAVLHLTENEKLDIERKFQKQRLDLQSEYNLRVKLADLTAQKVNIEAKTALEREGNKQVLADSLALIEIQKQEELAKAKAKYDELTIDYNEYQTELTRINGDALNKRYEAEKEFKIKEIDLQQTDIASTAAHEKSILELKKNSLTVGIFEKQRATQEEFDLETQRLNAQKILLDKELDAKKINDIQYKQQKEAIDDELLANKQAKDKQQYEFTVQLAQKSLQTTAQFAQMAVQAWQEANDQIFEQRLASLERAKNAELALDNTSNVQKAAIRNKYLLEERKIKIEQWKVDQRAKETQAGINIALGITNALATAPTIIAGLALAAVVAATGAVELSFIASQKPPAFAEGVVNFQGKGTGTSDSNHVMISHGESVITAKATERYAPYLEAMNAGMPIPQFTHPSVSSEIMNTFINHIPDFDYDKLGNVLAEKMKQNPQFHLTLDQAGYSMHVQKGIHRSKLLNNRIETK